MKDWQRSPEPPSMMGPPPSAYASQGGSSSVLAGDDQRNFPSSSEEPSSQRPLRSRTKADVTLGEMSRRVIMQKIHLFDTFGSTPFPIVRSILESCPAKKLYSLEEESPHFIPHTGYIWRKLCIKDFRDVAQASQAGTLTEAKDWRLLHATKQAAQQEALEAAAARVKEKYASLEAERIAHRARVVSAASTNGTSYSNRGSSRSGRGRMNVSSSNLTTGQKLLREARKQGNAKMQMTHSVRKTASAAVSASPIQNQHTSPPAKRPRMASDLIAPSSHTTTTTAIAATAEMGTPCFTRNNSTSSSTHQGSSPTTNAFSNHHSPSKSSSIFIQKRRIPHGSPSLSRRFQ